MHPANPLRVQVQSFRWWLVACFVANIFIFVATRLSPPSAAEGWFVAGLCLAVPYVVLAYKLAKALELKNAWFYAVGGFIPFVSLFVFIRLQMEASRWLRAAKQNR